MPNDKVKTNVGQSKVHEIFNADGTPVLKEDGTPLTMTQEEWRNRDKTVGYIRADDVEQAEGETSVPVG